MDRTTQQGPPGDYPPALNVTQRNLENEMANHLRRGLNKLSDAISNTLNPDRDPTENVVDESVTAAGTEGLTGPEAATAAAHGDFEDDDLTQVFGPVTPVAPHSHVDFGDEQRIGDPDTVPAPAPQPTVQQTTSLRIEGLAKQYVLKGYESLQRTPSASLSDNYRSSLLHMRDIVNTIHKAGVKVIGRITATVVATLAVDQRGKIDAVSFLRQIMRQSVWQASVDIARYRRAESKAQRRFGEEDDARDAPYGMDGISDHSDAIQGVSGSSESVEFNEADIISALVEVNGFLSAFADTICDDANDRLYFGLESGLSYIDKPGPMAGQWVGVFDPDEAVDIQLIKNTESQMRRDAERTLRRKAQLAALAAALDG
jgi:hypothetical protein